MRSGSQLPAVIDALKEGFEADKQPTLLLGEGCARNAGLPNTEALINAIGDELAKLSITPSPPPRKPDGSHDPQSVLLALKELPTLHRRRIVDPLIDVPVSSAYQSLAAIAAAGYFRVILTTNYDTLLERALSGVGLRPGYGLTVTDLASPYVTTAARLQPDLGVAAVKLRGDLADGTLVVDQKQQKALLQRNWRAVQRELKRVLVVVGEEHEMETIRDWVMGGSQREVWWVSSATGVYTSERVINVINGDDADPERFFGLLDYYLIRKPVDERLGISPSLAPSLEGLPTSTGDDPADTEYLSSLLRKSAAVTRSINWWPSSAVGSAQTQSQLEYQSQLTSRVETALASAANVGWVEVVGLLVQQALQLIARSPDSTEAVEAYVASQLAAVLRESASDAPSEFIVSAAAVATSNVVQQLGLVDNPELIHSLERAGKRESTGESSRG